MRKSRESRTIRFAPNETRDIFLVPCRDDFSLEDRVNLWYGTEDILLFKQKAILLGSLLRKNQDFFLKDSEELVSRGLEKIIDKNRSIQKRSIMRTILFYSNYHKSDAESIGRVAELCTQSSRSEARITGLRDELATLAFNDKATLGLCDTWSDARSFI